MKKKSILLLSASAGAGHMRAAQALVDTAKALALPIELRHEDILSFTFPIFRKIYRDIQFAIVDRSPDLWGYLYRKTEFSGTPKPAPPLIKLFNHFNYKKYLKLLHDTNPDAVLSTHFLPYAAIAERLSSSSWKLPFFAVTTDYDLHSLWVNRSVKRYYVGTEEVSWALRSHGIAAGSIRVTGIPVCPPFARRPGQRSARLQMGFSPNRFTIMVLSGGFGVGIVDQAVSAIAEVLAANGRRRFQLLVVCGKNGKLYDKLGRMKLPDNIQAHLYEHVSFVDRLMDCADLLVTKSGGLTLSEALAKQLPMILFDPVPGQEGRNALYFVENGAAICASSLSNLQFKLNRLIEQPPLLVKMRKSAAAIARPDAAERILEDVMSCI